MLRGVMRSRVAPAPRGSRAAPSTAGAPTVTTATTPSWESGSVALGLAMLAWIHDRFGLAVHPRSLERVATRGKKRCLDHVIVFNAAGLRRVLNRHVEYHEQSRTHF